MFGIGRDTYPVADSSELKVRTESIWNALSQVQIQNLLSNPIEDFFFLERDGFTKC